MRKKPKNRQKRPMKTKLAERCHKLVSNVSYFTHFTRFVALLKISVPVFEFSNKNIREIIIGKWAL